MNVSSLTNDANFVLEVWTRLWNINVFIFYFTFKIKINMFEAKNM